MNKTVRTTGCEHNPTGAVNDGIIGKPHRGCPLNRKNIKKPCRWARVTKGEQ